MFLPLDNLLDDSLKRARIKPQMEATSAMDHFRQIAISVWGGAFLEKVKPLYLKDKCLSVSVYSGLYAQEIRLREREILKEINARMKKEVVQRIRCLI